MFYNIKNKTVVLVYVDDCLVVGPSEGVKATLEELKDLYPCKEVMPEVQNDGSAKYGFLGLEIYYKKYESIVFK